MYYIKQVNAVKLVSEREALPLILEWLTRPGFTIVKAEDTIIVGGTRRVCDILRLNLNSLPLLGVFNDLSFTSRTGHAARRSPRWC